MDNCTIIFIILLLLALIASGVFAGLNYPEESDNKRRIQWIIGIIAIVLFFILSIVLYCYYIYGKGRGLRKEFEEYKRKCQAQLNKNLSATSQLLASASLQNTKL